jgi:TRAP-type C4-dicarboxylate transport system permease small subunit
MGKKLLYVLDNIESYICRTLLAIFVCLLFLQILSRQFFGYSFSWNEELSVYLFVWFVFFGASYAAKLAAHNRVTFQFKIMPAFMRPILEVLSDLVWVAFNCFFIYLCVDFIFNKMLPFNKSQTLGIHMKYFYMVLPIAFTLMTFRILQVNYYRLILGVDIRDPDSQELDELKELDLDLSEDDKNKK